MKLTFNRSSWHYKLAEFGNFKDWKDSDQNICAYTRAFIKGCLQCLLIGVGIALFGHIIWCGIFGVAFSLWYGVFLMDELAIAGAGIIAVAAIITTGIWVSGILADRKIRRLNEEYHNPKPPATKKPDGFVVNAYKAWSQKFCIKLEFTGNE